MQLMLQELNLARDKLKVLRHELACKEALHKAKRLELEAVEEEEIKKAGVAKGVLHKANHKQNPPGGSRRQYQRSHSMGGAPGGTNKPVLEEKRVENRRLLKRQSARLLSSDGEPAENLIEIEEAKLLTSRPSKSGPSFSDDAPSRVKGKDVQRRSSIARPPRRAAEKVQTYKEPPLKLKMRRVD
ncbi:hypothetical protein SAY87_028657 [Trapa incisa]|uniref:Shugoshin C-terminal domain-containing protein n=1 Tax=Trapa incisa TaxID=236973 RepID=A0AAN7KPJ8_9MYRT|nr:hypothetical protein SAY87_028657 [Trapa incisa]